MDGPSAKHWERANDVSTGKNDPSLWMGSVRPVLLKVSHFESLSSLRGASCMDVTLLAYQSARCGLLLLLCLD